MQRNKKMIIRLENTDKVRSKQSELTDGICWFMAIAFVYFHYHPFTEARYDALLNKTKQINGTLNGLDSVYENPIPQWRLMLELGFVCAAPYRSNSRIKFTHANLRYYLLQRGPLWAALEGHDITINGVGPRHIYYHDAIHNKQAKMSIYHFNRQIDKGSPMKSPDLSVNKYFLNGINLWHYVGYAKAHEKTLALCCSLMLDARYSRLTMLMQISISKTIQKELEKIQTQNNQSCAREHNPIFIKDNKTLTEEVTKKLEQYCEQIEKAYHEEFPTPIEAYRFT